MSGKAIGIGVSVVAVVVALVIFKTQPETDAAEADSSSAPAAPAVFAKSLEGTTPDGVIQNAGGELVLDEGLIERFDYYLSAIGERTLADIRKEVEAALDKELTPKAATEAKRLFASYVEFKQALKSLTPDSATGNDMESVRAARASILALRSRFFSPAEVIALFGKNDELENDSFARMDIVKNQNLSAAQKKAQFAELDGRLPAAVREGRAPDMKHHSLLEAERAARARGASEAELLQIRTEMAGPEVAKNLAAFDREEAEWKKRVDAYLAERKRLLGFAGMAEADRQAEANKLRERTFNAQEQLRVVAYE